MHCKSGFSLPASPRLAFGTFVFFLVIFASAASFAHAGSVYVPVDSWSYPAAERLAILTGTRLEALGMRPWTRAQFASFLGRAREMPHDDEADELQARLEREFSPELGGTPESVRVDSTYTRIAQIAGTPLRDSYHFGQTIADDYGRPYGQGFNNVTGSSEYAQYRAGFVYVRGEYQHGASLRAPTASAIQELANVDLVSDPSKIVTQGGAAVDYSRLVDAYVGVSFGRFTGTLGKQSLWWGPAAGGSMQYSNNIEPIWMARLTNDRPYRIPILGKARLDMFYGKLQGHYVEPQVWIHGEKITFQPLNSLEIGFTRTVVMFGVDYPFTLKRLWRSYFSVDDNNQTYFAKYNPGDRQGGVDFSWKLPRLPMTLYSDMYCDDDPSPLANPPRGAYHSGVYIARLPGALAKMDLRMEGAYTESEASDVPNHYNYWKEDYRDGYTNKGQLIGDTVGRAGVAWQAWSTYWFSARNKLQVSYRNNYISPQFIKGGGTQNTLRAVANMEFKHTIELELGVQPERIRMPLLTGSSAAQHNVSGWVGVKYSPEHNSSAPKLPHHD
jgi:hypothetical protein